MRSVTNNLNTLQGENTDPYSHDALAVKFGWSTTFDDPKGTFSSRPFIFIGACSRSGSTLLRFMMDSHTEIAAGPESRLCAASPIDIEHLSKAFKVELSNLKQIQLMSVTRTEFIERFADQYCKRRNKPIWCDKTSRNIYRLEYILRTFPNARFLALIRNPLDTVASLRYHPKWRMVNGLRTPTNFMRAWKDAAERWILAARCIQRHRYSAQVKIVRYEDLVFNQQKTLTSICQFLNLNYESRMLEHWLHHEDERASEFFPNNWESNCKVNSLSIDRWRTEIPSSELSWLIPQTAPLAEEFGYDLLYPER